MEVCKWLCLFGRVLIAACDLIGSPWGAGTFAASDGSRMPSKLEKDIAMCQGSAFYETVSRVKWA